CLSDVDNQTLGSLSTSPTALLSSNTARRITSPCLLNLTSCETTSTELQSTLDSGLRILVVPPTPGSMTHLLLRRDRGTRLERLRTAARCLLTALLSLIVCFILATEFAPSAHAAFANSLRAGFLASSKVLTLM